MKTKVKEKIGKIKVGINKVKEKIASNLKNKNNLKLNKQNFKYYSLLLLMITVAIVTTYLNIVNYKKTNEENYTKYSLNEIEKEGAFEEEQDKEELVETMAVQKYETKESSLSTVKFYREKLWPVQGTVVQPYSMDNVIYYESLGMWKVHPGVDVSSYQDEEVVCILDGKVIGIYNDDVLGYSVVVDCEEYTCIYSSLSNNVKVKIGENVVKGDILGNISLNPSEESLGYHLHFEVLKDGEYVDPKVLGIE